MKNLIKKLDPKYLKICLYAAVTVVLTFGMIEILRYSGGFWSKLWEITTAVLKPIIIGGVISYLFLPIVNKIESLINGKKEHKWARAVGIFATFILVIAVISFIIILMVVTVSKNIEAINIDTIKSLLLSVQEDNKAIFDFVKDKLGNAGNALGSAGSIVSKIKEFFSNLLFGIIFSIYFMADGKRISTYWIRALRVIFGEKQEKMLQDFLADADNAFSGYIRGQFIDAFIVGVLTTLALLVTRVPNAVLVGVLVAVGNLIPYIGPVVGYITVIIVCLPTMAFDKLLVGVIVLTIVMFIDGNIINPKLLGDNVEVHPLLVVAALIGGGALGGLVGMVVAVPVAALIKLQFDRYLDNVEKDKEEENTPQE